MMELGIGMQGLERQYEAHLLESIDYVFPYIYVEIGVAQGRTLCSVAKLLSETLKGQWATVGVELPDGYSLDRDMITQNAQRVSIPLNMIEVIGDVANPRMKEISVFFKDSQVFLTENWGAMINFALIDGCHCKKCATLDFLAVEPFIKHGGVVAFHDFMPMDKDTQPRGHENCNVLGAAEQLGLSDGSRPGWGYITTMKAAPGGADMGLFRRTR